MPSKNMYTATVEKLEQLLDQDQQAIRDFRSGIISSDGLRSELPLQSKFKTSKTNRDGKIYVGSERHFFGFCFSTDTNQIDTVESIFRITRWDQ